MRKNQLGKWNGHRKYRGLSIIEVIISIALISIITVALLPAFISGIKIITNAGDLSKTVYLSQEQTESDLINGATSSSDELKIIFPSTPIITIKVNGQQMSNESVQFFIPE